MMIKDINQLITDYLSGHISKEDFLKMRQIVNKLSDEEIKELLGHAWMKEEVSKDVFETRAASLLPNIKKQIAMNTTSESNAKKKVHSTIKMWRTIGQYAALLVLFFSCASTLYFYQDHQAFKKFMDQEVIFSSPSGQQANIVLPDGTEVSLNSQSELRYKQSFGKVKRELHFKGEAFFKVAKDSTKPFIIHTNDFLVKVLGTTFNLRSYDHEDYSDVALVEGHVQVNTNNNQIVQLSPNEKATYNKLTKQLTKGSCHIQTEISWTNPQLIFEETPIREVIRTLERRYRVHILTDKESWLDDLYTATFTNDNLDNILNVLKMHYKFKIERDTENSEILLSFEK